MTTKPSDLIAIANPQLAEKLAEKKSSSKKTSSPDNDSPRNNAEHAESNAPAYKTYNQEVWRAVFTLNIFRYFFALIILGLGLFNDVIPDFQGLKSLNHPAIFTVCAIVLLASASLFTLLTKTRGLPLRTILVSQFSIDTLAAGFIVHATGSIASGFSLLFFLIVITGSVVLSRAQAVALAAGSVMVIFFEHFYSVLISIEIVEWRFDSLAMYGILLMAVGLGVSHFARMIRRAEMKSFVPGNESIEEYLVREEINALKSALSASNGNKTEAAKLLGMTFRSFRYKVSKYEIQ